MISLLIWCAHRLVMSCQSSAQVRCPCILLGAEVSLAADLLRCFDLAQTVLEFRAPPMARSMSSGAEWMKVVGEPVIQRNANDEVERECNAQRSTD